MKSIITFIHEKLKVTPNIIDDDFGIQSKQDLEIIVNAIADYVSNSAAEADMDSSEVIEELEANGIYYDITRDGRTDELLEYFEFNNYKFPHITTADELEEFLERYNDDLTLMIIAYLESEM